MSVCTFADATDQWARTDPAFFVIMVGFLSVASVAFGIAFHGSVLAVLRSVRRVFFGRGGNSLGECFSPQRTHLVVPDRDLARARTQTHSHSHTHTHTHTHRSVDRLLLWSVFIDFIGVGVVIATICWYAPVAGLPRGGSLVVERNV